MNNSTPKQNEERAKIEITINKEWLDRLVDIVDLLASEIENDENVEVHGYLSHLLGYVHSLDGYFKGGTK